MHHGDHRGSLRQRAKPRAQIFHIQMQNAAFIHAHNQRRLRQVGGKMRHPKNPLFWGFDSYLLQQCRDEAVTAA
jgi:hypothetical protein